MGSIVLEISLCYQKTKSTFKFNLLGRLEELAQQEDRREKALVVGTAAALAVGLLAYIVK